MMLACVAAALMICVDAGPAKDAWDNHFAAFGTQDLDKIKEDYHEHAVIEVYNAWDGSLNTYKGMPGVTEAFTNLFHTLHDTSNLAAPVINVTEAAGKTVGSVFLVWKCPASGYAHATDTFLFHDEQPEKIFRQNVVVYWENPDGKQKDITESPPKEGGTVLAAWQNHFAGFGQQNVSMILQDYTQDSVVSVYNTASEKFTKYVGLDGVQDLFVGLFKELSCTDDLGAPIIHEEEFSSGGMVFLIWNAPCSGYRNATDTFFFNSHGKILVQNIVVDYELPTSRLFTLQSVTDTHASPVATVVPLFIMAAAAWTAVALWRGRRTSNLLLEDALTDGASMEALE